MRVCPSCKTQYTDDSLAFCLQDGTPLVGIDRVSSSATVDESEAIVRERNRVPEGMREQPSEVTRFSRETGAKKTSSVFLIIAIVALLLLIFAGVVIVVAFVLLRPTPFVNNTVINSPTPVSTVTNTNRSGMPTPNATTNLNVAFVTPSPTPMTEDPATVRREVAARLNDWKSATESLNVNSLMRYYADTVDYYRRGSTSAAFVRNDKQRAFTRFSSIRITISNLNVSADPSGDRATAVFDKEWVFEGARISSGKVKSRLQFRKINGEWLITGERDLSVYYVN
jgi:hypothetical protein